MTRPPRPPDEHVLGAGLWHRVLAFAALITTLSLGAALWAEQHGRPWQSILFITLLAAQLGICLGLRASWRTRENLFLPAAVLTSALLGVAALYLPALQAILLTEPLSGSELLPALLAAGVGVAAAQAVARSHRSSR